MILPVILAGGTGTRLWPFSQSDCPKQFLSIFNQYSLLQTTLEYIKALPQALDPLIICNEACYDIAKQQTEAISKPFSILVEAIGRNTAPAALLTALYVTHLNIDPTLLLLPSDHYISDPDYFIQCIQTARTLSPLGKLVTFGIKPTKPHTGYGYIKAETLFSETTAYQVSAFIEKPDLVKATQYLNEGNYYWNSGIFVFKASALLREAGLHAPELLAVTRQIFKEASIENQLVKFSMDSMQCCPDISIDHAIMEKTQNALMIPFESIWADLGDWSTIWELSKKDISNNVFGGEVFSVDTENSYIRSHSRPIVAIGIKNQVIVETPEGILIADISQIQEVKKIVQQWIDKSYVK